MKNRFVLLVLLFFFAVACRADSPPAGNLSLDHTVVYVGDTVTIFVDGSDNVDVKQLAASFDGNWHYFDCAGIQLSCSSNWTFIPSAAGSYDVMGWVRDSADNGVPTTPDTVSLLVVSMSTTTTTTLGTTSTTNTITTTTVPATSSSTTSSSTTTFISSTTSTTRPRDYLAVIGNFVNYIICAILQSIWALAAGLAALVIIFAGVRYMTSEEMDSWDKAKKSIIHVFAALLVIFVAVPVVNYFVTGTSVKEISCGGFVGGPPITFTNGTLAPTTTSVPDDRCVIKGVFIGGVLFNCGTADSLCPQKFNPTSGGCPPRSKTVCNPVDPDC